MTSLMTPLTTPLTTPLVLSLCACVDRRALEQLASLDGSRLVHEKLKRVQSELQR